MYFIGCGAIFISRLNGLLPAAKIINQAFALPSTSLPSFTFTLAKRQNSLGDDHTKPSFKQAFNSCSKAISEFSACHWIACCHGFTLCRNFGERYGTDAQHVVLVILVVIRLVKLERVIRPSRNSRLIRQCAGAVVGCIHVPIASRLSVGIPVRKIRGNCIYAKTRTFVRVANRCAVSIDSER